MQLASTVHTDLLGEDEGLTVVCDNMDDGFQNMVYIVTHTHSIHIYIVYMLTDLDVSCAVRAMMTAWADGSVADSNVRRRTPHGRAAVQGTA
jgi:hypothetical protein